MRCMIKRDIELYLEQIASEFPVVSVMGPRQSGKTTLVRTHFSDYSYLNLGDPAVRLEAETDGSAFFRNHPAPLILDEVQNCPQLLSYIQVLVDDDPHGKARYVLTGSHQPKLREGIVQSLAGRVGEVELLPLSISELRKAGVLLSREEQIFNGFMPRLYAEKVSAANLYANYFSTYVERDVSKLINLKDRRRFEAFMRVLAGRVGQLLNCDSISAEIGVSSVTIRHWISILEASYIVFTLPPYYRNYGKRFVKTPKVYFVEIGLLAYLLGIRTPGQVVRDPLFGGIFENMVVTEMRKARLNAGLRGDMYFIRDQNGKEIDLVIEEARRLRLFEIKSGSEMSPSFARNLKSYREVLGEDLLSSAIVYSGTTNRHLDPQYLNFAETGTACPVK